MPQKAGEMKEIKLSMKDEESNRNQKTPPKKEISSFDKEYDKDDSSPLTFCRMFKNCCYFYGRIPSIFISETPSLGRPFKALFACAQLQMICMFITSLSYIYDKELHLMEESEEVILSATTIGSPLLTVVMMRFLYPLLSLFLLRSNKASNTILAVVGVIVLSVICIASQLTILILVNRISVM